MAETLLVTGGLLRPNGFELGEGKYYGCARLLRLDTATGGVETLLSVDQGNDNFPAGDPNLEFTVGDVEDDKLWLTTDTEVRLYQYPSLQLLKTYSHPCFHNVHSVAVRGDELYVTSTGLDMVVVLDKYDGSIRALHNTEGKPVWHRFSEHVDYRKQHSTRPHDAHPNFVFWAEGRPWVTRCTQEDAVMLGDPSRCLDISGDRKPISVHDGLVHDGSIYFTIVDGTIVVADAQARRIVRTIETTKLKGFGGLRGWCRGIYIAGDLAYVAFSRLRKTKRLDKLAWVSRLLGEGKVIEECSVLAVDLKDETIVGDYRLPLGSIDAVYSLLPEPQAR